MSVPYDGYVRWSSTTPSVLADCRGDGENSKIDGTPACQQNIVAKVFKLC